jgi:NADH-quinone oxidoreductase subunit N
MNLPETSYSELLKFAAPEMLVVLGALLVLAVDLVALREVDATTRRLICAMFACAGTLAAAAWLLIAAPTSGDFQGMLAADPVTRGVQVCLLALAFITTVLATETNPGQHVGEFFATVLFSTAGMMFMVGARDVLLLFISLELTSLSLYVLAGFNRDSGASAEAALKYFLFGGVAAGFTLFGLSWLYGLTGSTDFQGIASGIMQKTGSSGALTSQRGLDPLLAGALAMTLAGFGFKLAAVPFHFWAPDVYEAAPAICAGWIASASKLSGFVVLANLLTLGFAGAEGGAGWHHFAPGWVSVLALLAALSMVFGNLVALAQRDVRRLLAYSAIAHTGYMLVGVLSGKTGLAPLLYYALTYGLTVLGAFGVISVVQGQTGSSRFSDFASLNRRAPVLAACMMVFMLSLAGIPPLAGFFGKFYLFAAALKTTPGNLGLLWLVVVAIGTSVVSFYYYAQVLKALYLAEPPNGPFPKIPLRTQLVVGILAAAVLVLGCAPELLLARFGY